jgi:hypothetical protein
MLYLFESIVHVILLILLFWWNKLQDEFLATTQEEVSYIQMSELAGARSGNMREFPL